MIIRKFKFIVYLRLGGISSTVELPFYTRWVRCSNRLFLNMTNLLLRIKKLKVLFQNLSLYYYCYIISRITIQKQNNIRYALLLLIIAFTLNKLTEVFYLFFSLLDTTDYCIGYDEEQNIAEQSTNTHKRQAEEISGREYPKRKRFIPEGESSYENEAEGESPYESGYEGETEGEAESESSYESAHEGEAESEAGSANESEGEAEGEARSESEGEDQSKGKALSEGEAESKALPEDKSDASSYDTPWDTSDFAKNFSEETKSTDKYFKKDDKSRLDLYHEWKNIQEKKQHVADLALERQKINKAHARLQDYDSIVKARKEAEILKVLVEKDLELEKVKKNLKRALLSYREKKSNYNNNNGLNSDFD